MSLHYSPTCRTWDKSAIGQRMSCMLLCEVIVDPQHVKVGLKGKEANHFQTIQFKRLKIVLINLKMYRQMIQK